MGHGEHDFHGMNTDTIMRYGLGGLAAGTSAAALWNLVKEINRQSTEAKERADLENNKITIAIPKEAAVKTEGPKVVNRPATYKNQVIYADGQFGKVISTKPKTTPTTEKKADYDTLVASILAAAGAGYLGVKGVNAAFDANRKSNLEDEIAEEKAKYQELLASHLKQASYEGSDTFGIGDYPLALAALAAIVGTGTVAFGTKKILDDVNRPAKSEFEAPITPRVDRIEFKQACVKEAAVAAMGLMLDVQAGTTDVLDDYYVAKTACALDLTPADLYKVAYDNEEYTKLTNLLQGNDEIRTALKRSAMDKHPILSHLKWFADAPIVGDVADNYLYDSLSKQMGPQKDMELAAARVSEKYAETKTAFGGPVAHSVLGSLMANKVTEDEEQAAQQEQLGPDAVTVDGVSPEMDEYIQEHKEEIEQLIREHVMQQTGSVSEKQSQAIGNIAKLVGAGATGAGLTALYNKYQNAKDDEATAHYISSLHNELANEQNKMNPLLAGAIGALTGAAGKTIYDKVTGY